MFIIGGTSMIGSVFLPQSWLQLYLLFTIFSWLTDHKKTHKKSGSGQKISYI